MSTPQRSFHGPNVQMLLSKSCEYGLRAMLYLGTLDQEAAEADEGSGATREYVSIQTVSDDLEIGFSFLTKVFQQLNDAGLLTSKRGPGGGVALTRAPGATSLYEIVVAIDGNDLFQECVLGLPGCGEAEPCPLHEHWTEERDRMKTTFQRTTLSEVPDVRLTPFIDDLAEAEEAST
ncbi:RrF2 family transcriptional regulator [Salinibacter grassmerensis]|uniref:RrF2 family transcriptional regulator n=1 Tax=Salinibacter grassmerensis TaxID=3040353 RepID=UPI0021E85CE1|nr:Rrf2 family transcriptional regulator [Salinibacter grassmerensis]